MDPLSITAAVVGIGTAAASTANAFKDLRRLCNALPGRLHALSNEVSDIELVLQQVTSVAERRSNDAVLREQESHIRHLLDQAGSKLAELRTIVETLTAIVKASKVPVFRAHAWRKNQPRLQALQEDIKNVKCNLNIMLGTFNSLDMMKIRVDLETVTAVHSNSHISLEENLQKSLVRHRDDLAEVLKHLYQQVDHRIGTVEKLLEVQATRIEASQLNQLGNAYRHQAMHSKPLPPSRRQTQHQDFRNSEDVGIRVRPAGPCQSACPCQCHIQTSCSTPGVFDRILGQMFVGYAGLPLVNAKCDTASCEKNQNARISVEYWFPFAFVWSTILRFQMTYQPHLGPQFKLSTLRRVPDSAQCVHFALNGNMEGLKDLFRSGLASPCDVSTTRGYSLLRWAMYGKQYQTCKFLFNTGADADYRPLAASDNSPRNKAHQFLLMGGLSHEDVEALRCLTQGDDFIEEQNYTLLHKIILGLSMANLEEEICLHPEQINTADVMGRTPLAWAACRGDERAIVTLLSHGAEVNTIDIQYSGVVGHAADRSYVTCVRLLLEAGADPDIAAVHNHKVGNPLNVAARNASDPLVLKTLLDFGADVESSGIDGMTALIHAARRDNAAFATLLLEYGANINATSKSGQTPLTATVTYNSHNVLKLLLDRWFEYSECPRLSGPNLLQIAAIYADVETITILTNADHLHLKYDSSYALGDFRSRLRHRTDASEKLILAFEELMGIIEQGPSQRQVFKDEESGLAQPCTSDSDSDTFENALESLDLTKESIKTFDRPTICRLKSRTF
ncbi:MAG: hypothetical protein LQ342_008229 [Letrouitia transgressa]|nr:MAG: hypothetical protein LQ342_008229 [Letrouitia transgressa]